MKYMYKTMLISFFTNILLVILKLIAGIMANCKALVADAVHSFSDLSTDIVAIIGQKLSTPVADKKHPYGHGKIEYITSIIIGTAIMIVGGSLIINTFKSKTTLPNDNIIVLSIVSFTIVAKYILASYIIRQGKKHRNGILKASGHESMSDVYSAISVLITMLLSNLTKYFNIFKYADKLGSLIISIFILKTAWNILRDNINAILDEAEQDNEIIEEIKETIMSIKGVENVDNMILTKYGSYYHATLYVDIDSNQSFKEAHQIAHNIEDILLEDQYKIKYVAVHINPSEKNIS